MKLKHAMLYVKDFAGMSEFYGSQLGLTAIPETRSQGWIEFAEGLALHAIPPHIADGIVIASPPEPREETPIKLIFRVDDLDAIAAKLEAAGVALMRRPWGAVDCVDPEGNIFQLSRA